MGLRVSEVVALHVADIDSAAMRVHIRRAKGKKDRYVHLPESLLEQLRTYFKAYRPKVLLFEGQQGGPYSTRSAQKVFADALLRAKVNKKVGIHGLRHSYATHLLEAGTDIAHIQKLLGHSDIKTTLLYTQITNSTLQKVKSPLDSL
jgi:integrase/recombinase XerD